MVDIVGGNMYIKQILESNMHESDIIVTDGFYEVLCCYCTCENISVGSRVDIISTLLSENIMTSKKTEYVIEKKNDYYSYFLTCKVVDKDLPLVQLGELKMELDSPLPKDIKIGDFIEFYVSRLDC